MIADLPLEERVRLGLERARKLIGSNDNLALSTCLSIILTTDPDRPPQGDFFGYCRRLEPTLSRGFDALKEGIEQLFLREPFHAAD